ncbi:hypothetical protein DICSQDRAFT_97406 [Dichomitus squalens LYAD-421 SS1]|uniref:uncharacterized protein n=1 Tax=Dichomitus squalens (strain LYAD-421) TaxID=732165 RepID=UPI00044123B3|nr:uncharacterized protein DICSQDRAFT_97406 [Dichomitus squalens LYAD-421 SS1]EJF65857.1 hypothetical protein DICSQDRAFT_97406 [Dichomitus squalens LYAD-421 SS1]
MPPRPSHKRAATSRDDSTPAAAGSRKKTRFVEPSEDPVNFAEEVDAQLENPSAQRKGRVKTEGYDSDSSDDGEGVVNSRKPGGTGAVGDDDEDMFMMGDKEEAKAEKQGVKKKEETFLRLGDIEGQEFGAGEDEDDGDEDEPEDEDDAERRKKAGMGFELSAFNMREEMEEGKFSADGMYVRTFDPHAVHDKWMEGLDEREIKKARKLHKAQERLQKERQRAEERELEELGGKDYIEQQLIGMLKKGETVLEALQRLGAKAKKSGTTKKKPNNKTKRDAENGSGAAMEVDQTPKSTSTEATDVETITHFASTLMSLGDTDIYGKTYEELVRSVRASGKVDKDWIPPSADVEYEYKWAVPEAGDADQVFGPFSEEEMQAWYGAAYFGSAGEKVKVRRVGGEWGNWNDVVSS